MASLALAVQFKLLTPSLQDPSRPCPYSSLPGCDPARPVSFVPLTFEFSSVFRSLSSCSLLQAPFSLRSWLLLVVPSQSKHYFLNPVHSTYYRPFTWINPECTLLTFGLSACLSLVSSYLFGFAWISHIFRLEGTRIPGKPGLCLFLFVAMSTLLSKWSDRKYVCRLNERVPF